MRTFVVGDIHGQYEELLGALEFSGYSERDRLICLGDYIDRGKGSRQVLDFLIGAKRKNPSSVFLRGDHEEVLMKCLSGKAPACRAWLDAHYGMETLASYGFEGKIIPTSENISEVFPQGHIKFLLDTVAGYDYRDYAFRHSDEGYAGDKVLIYGHDHNPLRPLVGLLRINLALDDAVAVLDLDEFTIRDSEGIEHAVDEAISVCKRHFL
jgi:hypothetical protein